MACSSCVTQIQKYGANPASIQWTVVRGDTATLTIEFLDLDETTPFDTDGWTYKATSYDPQGDVLDNLEVSATTGSVTITAEACVTENWGTKYKSVVAELPFDLSVNIPNGANDYIWTPVIGTICVLGDVTPGGSL